MVTKWGSGGFYCRLLLSVLFCCFHPGETATPPVTTVLPATVLPPNVWHTKFGASLHRRNKKLDVKAFAVFLDVSALQCLGLCIQHQSTDGKSPRICRSFNYAADRTCHLLNTYICDGERELTEAPGFSYYDLSDGFAPEMGFMKSKQCAYKGKCSNKCLKFKLFKTPMSWDEAKAACQAEEAFLAMPRDAYDHDTLIMMMKKGNLLQSWIGLRKRYDGYFYYDNGARMNNFTAWGPDQPNDSGGTQQCVQMTSEMDYLWNDFYCARPVGYICQYVY